MALLTKESAVRGDSGSRWSRLPVLLYNRSCAARVSHRKTTRHKFGQLLARECEGELAFKDNQITGFGSKTKTIQVQGDMCETIGRGWWSLCVSQQLHGWNASGFGLAPVACEDVHVADRDKLDAQTRDSQESLQLDSGSGKVAIMSLASVTFYQDKQEILSQIRCSIFVSDRAKAQADGENFLPMLPK